MEEYIYIYFKNTFEFLNENCEGDSKENAFKFAYFIENEKVYINGTNEFTCGYFYPVVNGGNSEFFKFHNDIYDMDDLSFNLITEEQFNNSYIVDLYLKSSDEIDFRDLEYFLQEKFQEDISVWQGEDRKNIFVNFIIHKCDYDIKKYNTLDFYIAGSNIVYSNIELH